MYSPTLLVGVPLARGLSFDFYRKSCPKAESIVRDVGLVGGDEAVGDVVDQVQSASHRPIGSDQSAADTPTGPYVKRNSSHTMTRSNRPLTGR